MRSEWTLIGANPFQDRFVPLSDTNMQVPCSHRVKCFLHRVPHSLDEPQRFFFFSALALTCILSHCVTLAIQQHSRQEESAYILPWFCLLAVLVALGLFCSNQAWHSQSSVLAVSQNCNCDLERNCNCNCISAIAMAFAFSICGPMWHSQMFKFQISIFKNGATRTPSLKMENYLDQHCILDCNCNCVFVKKKTKLELQLQF